MDIFLIFRNRFDVFIVKKSLSWGCIQGLQAGTGFLPFLRIARNGLGVLLILVSCLSKALSTGMCDLAHSFVGLSPFGLLSRINITVSVSST